MIERYQYQGVVWVDVVSPEKEEIRSLMKEFSLDPRVAEELLLPTTKSRIEMHPEYLYVILHFPALRHSHSEKEQEIDFVIGRDFIITTRYETIDPLHKFAKIFEVNTLLNKDAIGTHAGYVFYYMVRKMYASIEHEMSYIKDALMDIEKHIFEGKEREMVGWISHSGRDLLNLRQAIEPHRDILQEFTRLAPELFESGFERYANALTEEYYKMHNHLMRHTEFLHELRETNNSLLNTKQSEIMKLLTMMTFITAPLSLVAQLFSMNTVYTPIVGAVSGFWFICAAMGLAAGMLILFYKRNRWF